MKPYTFETYQYNTDKLRQLTVHCGSIGQILDGLSPCMVEVTTVNYPNKKQAVKHARTIAKERGYKLVI